MLYQAFKLLDILRDLGPLQIISYALEIGLSIIKLLWPEFLMMSTLMLSPGKFYNIAVIPVSISNLNDLLPGGQHVRGDEEVVQHFQPASRWLEGGHLDRNVPKIASL